VDARARDSFSAAGRLALCFAWAGLPALVYAWQTARAGHPIGAAAMLLVSIGALLLPSLWARSIRGFLLSLLPFALLTVCMVCYAVEYRSPIMPGFVSTVLITDPRIDLEEIAHYWWILAASVACAILYAAVAVSFRAAPLRGRAYAAGWAIWGLVASVYAPYAAQWLWMNRGISVKDTFLSRAYPQSLYYAAEPVWTASREAQPGDRTPIGDKYGVAPPARPAGRELFVLVIGETQREATWHELEGRLPAAGGNLVRFHDVLAQANWSRQSIPFVASGALTPQDELALPTITDWERWAGFATAVLSNNADYRFGRGADVKTILGERADVLRYNRYDHELLPMLAQLLGHEGLDKLCVTLHMVGSHGVYRERYEPRFGRFPVDLDDGLQATRNEYRNTIVMAQDFVRRLVERLEHYDGAAFLAFTSDHGENLREINGLVEHVTMTPTEYELKVPMFFWANDRYVRAHEEAWRALHANAARPVANDNVVPTLLDAMGLLEQAKRVYRYGRSLMREAPDEARFYYTPDYARHPERDMLVDASAR